jgi:hypothetical protein
MLSVVMLNVVAPALGPIKIGRNEAFDESNLDETLKKD